MTRKQYSHVESKVSRYIQGIKSQDEIARQQKAQLKRQPRIRTNLSSESSLDDDCNKGDKCSYEELLAKYNTALAEIGNLRAENDFLMKSVKSCNRTGITEVTRITLVDDSDFEGTYGSTICSDDIRVASPQHSQLHNNCSTGDSYNVNTFVTKRKSFISICRTTTKKVLRKFLCGEENEAYDIAMKRVHTPKALNDFSKGIGSMSTPGRKTLKTRILHSSKKRTPARKVMFLANKYPEHRTTQIKQLIQHLNEVEEFLATLDKQRP